MRIFVFLVSLSLSLGLAAPASAEINELCQVTEVRSVKFDGFLEAFGDESLSFIGFSDVSGPEVTVGGFSFFPDSKTQVSVDSSSSTGVVVGITSQDFGNLEYSSVNASGCSYLSEVLSATRLKVVAVADCRIASRPESTVCAAGVAAVESRAQ